MGNDSISYIQESIINDMSEGVLTLGLDGVVTKINPAAERILGVSQSDAAGLPFAATFFEREENDTFNQTILDAIYDRGSSHRSVVPYSTGDKIKSIYVTTSFLMRGDEKIGVIAVLNDMTELVELRDAIKAMERIKALNAQLEIRNKLLNETFGRYLSDEIVRSLLETPGGLALGGKKRRVTILMSDLRGFTAMSERMPPEDVITMLNHYLAEMVEIVQRRSGTIIEFIGDAIFAIYGAPAQCADSAAQAVASAIEMQSRMNHVNEWNAANGFPHLEMGIGVNTGDVIVGNIGSEKRTKYGVVGQHVNLAGRLESYTVGGQVLISPTTLEEIGGAEVAINGTLEITPKGVKEPITIYDVTALGAPYNVSCVSEEGGALIPAKPGYSFTLRAIDGKHVGTEGLRADVKAVGETEALVGLGGARVLDNYQMELWQGEKLLAEEIFAKVVSAGEGGARLHFTSTPPDFGAALRGMTE